MRSRLALEFRRSSSLLFLLVLVVGVLQAPATAKASRETGRRESSESAGSDHLARKAARDGSVRVIVNLRSDFAPEARLDRAAVRSQRAGIDRAQTNLLNDLSGTDYRVLHEYRYVPAMALELSPRALRAARRSQQVDSLTLDRALEPVLGDSVPIVEGTTMWNAGHTGSGKVVAVLDTGVDKNHSFLSGKVVEEACFSDNMDCPNGQASQTGTGAGVPCTYAAEGCKHGTHVAGIAAGNDGPTFSGVAMDASIMAVQVFSQFTGANCTGAGEDPCALSFTSDQMAGLERVFAVRASHDFASVNMSLGGGQFFNTCDSGNEAYKGAIDNLRAAGIATVIASGNSGFTNSMGFPACISSAISVGSTTKNDGISSFSNSASFLSLLAPGSAITSSVPGGSFASFNGTSMAAPHVAGAWALMEQAHPADSVTDILTDLQNTGVPVTDNRPGGTQTKSRICIAAAAGLTTNDDFADAEAVSGSTATLTGSNGCATKEAGEPNHAGNVGGKSVWYDWTAPASGSTTIDTTGSNFDTLLGVYTGNAVTALTEIASNDDEGPPGVLTSKVTFTATAGTVYRIAVDGFNADMAAVTLNVAGQASGNQAPNAVNDTLTTNEDASNSVNVLANDTDPDGDTLSVSAKTNGTNGTVTCAPAGSCTYTPNANFNGSDSFTYTANDGNGGTDIGTVEVTVNPVNDAPNAVNDTLTTTQDTPNSVNVLTNDTDPDGDTLTVSADTDGANGTVTCAAGGSCTYTPDTGFTGTDSFTYTANDGNGGTDIGTVNVTVNDVNNAPNAVNDSLTTDEDVAGDVDVLANDTDADGDALSVTGATQGADGSVSCATGGLCTYTPDANFHGTDSFTYTLSDGNGGTDTGTVNVTVDSVADDVARTVTLNLRRHLRAKGKVTAAPGFDACTDGIAVKVQRKKGGRWKTVKSATTNSNGAFNTSIPDKTGTYRALAPARVAGGDNCRKDTSPTKRHRH